ncbi:MAG: 4-hydroxythreonine-4-phosphate dehydrogenase [Campylobacterales bacterium]
MKRLAISIGDLNGVGLEIALRAHHIIKKIVHPLYCVAPEVAKEGAELLGLTLPDDFSCMGGGYIKISPGVVSMQAGRESFASFVQALDLCDRGEVDGVVTLPIHKKAWELANISFKGHTDYLRWRYDRDAIMMLGCERLWVALFTEHIPLREVASRIERTTLADFLVRLARAHPFTHAVVLGLNPHAGDGGVLGDEEVEIEAAIALANEQLGASLFYGPAVPDTAFTPKALSTTRMIVALYHDQGLAPLKALYFEESINVSLDLPIRRSSVDHGTAFDIAYQGRASLTSYLQAIKYHLD